MRIYTLSFALALFMATSLTVSCVHAQSNEDHEAIKMAVLDYVEGLYLMQPERIERSVSKKLAKVGYVKSAAGYREVPLTYEQLHRISGRYNINGQLDPETAPKKIEILDVLDQISVVKLSADWGIDYLNLAKQEGRWKVINVLWQTYPEK